MKLGARNQLKGAVVAIDKGAVNSIVKIEVAPGVVLTSSITNASVAEPSALPRVPRHTRSSRPRTFS